MVECQNCEGPMKADSTYHAGLDVNFCSVVCQDHYTKEVFPSILKDVRKMGEARRQVIEKTQAEVVYDFSKQLQEFPEQAELIFRCGNKFFKSVKSMKSEELHIPLRFVTICELEELKEIKFESEAKDS